MIFRILGALEVAGAPSLGGPKQRALLAVLLIRADESVPVDVLVDEVWPSRAPATAAHAVQVYVSQLRKSLAGTQALIESGASGYRLAIAREEIDAHAFAALGEDGRRALGSGDPAAAVALCDRALALWRGPALAEFRYEPFAQSEIARLDELRLIVIEQRAEALLELGRHAELVPELERLVKTEPLRERLHAQLMLALYRSGRQADALAAYRDAARVLRETLGLDPGPELRELEAAILAQKPWLSGAEAVVALPAPVTALIGRDSEADDVAALLRGDARILTLTGVGGIGKTRLAIEAAARVAGGFAGGVFFAGLATVGSSDLVAATIAEAMSLPVTGADSLRAVVAEVGDRPTLLVVDNFEHVVEAGGNLSHLVVSCRGLKLLVTSRRALRIYGEHEYEVPPLGDREAVRLFQARGAARRRGELGEQDAIAEICRRLDGLPLAIELAAAQSALLTPRQMLEALPGRLDLAAAGPRDVPGRQQTLRATIGWSHDLLDEPVAAAFRRLSVFAGGWELAAARDVASAGLQELRPLAEHSLVFRGRSGRFRMLATIREFALEQLEQSGEAEAARRRHAEHFMALAERGDAMLRSGGHQVEALDDLEREHDNLRAALDWAAGSDPALHLRLAGALGSFWAVRGHLQEGRRRLEDAVSRAGSGADQAALARALAGAGTAARAQADHEAARPLLERSAALYRDLGDPSGVVRALAQLGFVHFALGEPVRAAASYAEGLESARASGNLRDRNLLLNCLADLELRAGRHGRVEELAAEALQIARQIGDAEGVAVSLMNRTHAAIGAGRAEEALALASLEAWVALGDETSAGWSLDVIAALVAERAPRTAARLIGAADAARHRAGIALDAFELGVRRHAQHKAASRLEPADFRQAFEEGAAGSFEDAVAEARREL